MAWTDKQLRAHKKASAGLSVATSTMGIGALSLVGARAGAPKLVRAAQKAGHLKSVKPKQLKKFKAKSTGLQNGLITTSAGVGGVGGLNYAAIQNAEAKRRPRAPRPVAKRDTTEVSMDGMDFGLGRVHQGSNGDEISKAKRKWDTGDTAQAVGGTLIGSGAAHGFRAAQHQTAGVMTEAALSPFGARRGSKLAKPDYKVARKLGRRGGKLALAGAATAGAGALTHSAIKHGKVNKAYDPEQKRLRRLDAYNAGTNAVAGGAAVGAAVAGHKLGHEIKSSVTTSHGKGGKTVHVSAAKLKPLGKKGAVTAALGLGAVGAAVGADRIRSYGRGNGRSYKPLHGQY